MVMSSPIWQGRSAFRHFAKAASEGATPAGLSLLSGLPLITNRRGGCLWGGSTRDVGRPCVCSQHQVLCTHQGRSLPGWHLLLQTLRVNLVIHPSCLHKRSLSPLLYASLFGAPSFTKAASAPVNP